MILDNICLTNTTSRPFMGLGLTCCSMANGQCLGTDKFGRDVTVYSDLLQGKNARFVAFKFHGEKKA